MKKQGLLLAVLSVVVIIVLIIIVKCELFSNDKKLQIGFYSKDKDSTDLYIDYTLDSLYKIEYDTIVRVSDTRSGKTINEFYVSLSTYPEYPFLRQMAIDPTGKYLAFLDNLNIASVYNIFTGECRINNKRHLISWYLLTLRGSKRVKFQIITAFRAFTF